MTDSFERKNIILYRKENVVGNGGLLHAIDHFPTTLYASILAKKKTLKIHRFVLAFHWVPAFSLSFNSFPNDKILDQTKLKAIADDKLNVTKMIISV